jgi:hypothetical protein
MWRLKKATFKTEPHEVSTRHDFFHGGALESVCLAGCGLVQLPTMLAGDALPIQGEHAVVDHSSRW